MAIILNTLQVRLACELASQVAAKAEISRQLSEQLGFSVEVEGAEIDIRHMELPQFDMNGEPVVWE